jgi:hypothetical protein
VKQQRTALARGLRGWALAAGLCCWLAASCAARHPLGPFRIVPAEPSYLLRSPDRQETPFPEVLSKYTGVSAGWVDLQGQMGLQVENAYFREGTPRRGMENFVGTELARYRVLNRGGLGLISVESKVAQRPPDQVPVQELLPATVARYRYHRFFYQLAFRLQGGVHGAALLGAPSMRELDRLGVRLLADPDSVCGSGQVQCAVFPEACTVSIEMEITVNGAPRTIPLGSLLQSVAVAPQQVTVLRRYAGRLTPVQMDAGDAGALRLPLLPGDQVDWK